MLSCIFAQTSDFVMGGNNTIPWFGEKRYENVRKFDMEAFKRFTMGKSIVMGRKTWDSLGRKPLKGRCDHYIITGSEKKIDTIDGVNVHYMSLDDFILRLSKPYCEEIVLIGGARLIESLYEYIDKLSITTFYLPGFGISGTDNFDTFTPNIFRDQTTSNWFKTWRRTKSLSIVDHIYGSKAEIEKFTRIKSTSK